MEINQKKWASGGISFPRKDTGLQPSHHRLRGDFVGARLPYPPRGRSCGGKTIPPGYHGTMTGLPELHHQLQPDDHHLGEPPHDVPSDNKNRPCPHPDQQFFVDGRVLFPLAAGLLGKYIRMNREDARMETMIYGSLLTLGGVPFNLIGWYGLRASARWVRKKPGRNWPPSAVVLFVDPFLLLATVIAF